MPWWYSRFTLRILYFMLILLVKCVHSVYTLLMARPPLFNPTRWRDGWRIMLPPAFSPSGKRAALLCASRAEADVIQRELLAAMRSEGRAHSLFNPSAADLQLRELKELSASVGLSVRDAVQEAVAARRLSASIALGELAALYLESLVDKSPPHVKAAKRIIASLVASLGASAVVDSLAPMDYEAWLYGCGADSSPYNWNLHVAHSKALFSWGMKRRLCACSPCDAVAKRKIHVDEIRILSPMEAQRIVDVCLESAPDALLAWAVLLFAGVRPEELGRLSLADFNLEERVIKLSSKVSKTNTLRLIVIEDNLFNLLSSWREPFLTPPNWMRKYKLVRKLSGIAQFKDVCRHSYASYHYGKYRDMGLLLDNLGHTTQQVTLKHYKTPPLPSAIEQYWRILAP